LLSVCVACGDELRAWLRFPVFHPLDLFLLMICFYYVDVLEYYHCWYTANIVNTSVFDAFSIGSGIVAAVLLCVSNGATL
jgi:hypothetical protein